jgi:arginase
VPELPPEDARRGYAVGARVLEALLPPHDGPTEVVPVPATEQPSRGGIESREAVRESLEAAQAAIARHDVEGILTLGGECSVSVAPFSALAERYGEDLAVVWIDAHPDADTPATGYDGYHAMAASLLMGHGDQEFLDLLPATVPAERFAFAGLHSGEDDALANLAVWGPEVFGPNALRESSAPLLEWLARTGASRVAIHLDVDVVDSDEVVLGLGQVPGGLSSAQVHRVIADLGAQAQIVGLTLAEYVPRQAIALGGMLRGLPLIGG